jgi:hypothetical protein
MRTPAQPKCWTDSSQRATLLRHRLHRLGVGRGTVVKLAGSQTAAAPTIVRINQRTATIDPGDGTSWCVGFALLRHVVDS